jgi:carboxylesterase type B
MQTPTNNTINQVAAHYPEDPTNPSTGFNAFTTDLGFACYSQVLSKTFKKKSYRYVMSIPPATHGLDQMYYFYIDNVTAPSSVNVLLARRFQQYLRQFIIYGDPNGPNEGEPSTNGGISAGTWPDYEQGKIFNITSNGFEVAIDPWSLGGTCEFIQRLVDDPANNF